MPHLSGVVTAGIPEATRLANALIHRGAEAGIVVTTGERADRAHAERLPEAGAGERISEHEGERERRRGRGGRGREHGAEASPEQADDPAAGALVDLRA